MDELPQLSRRFVLERFGLHGGYGARIPTVAAAREEPSFENDRARKGICMIRRLAEGLFAADLRFVNSARINSGEFPVAAASCP